MGLQKFRADIVGKAEENGSIPVYTRWMAGDTLALIRNCPVQHTTADVSDIAPRTVYIRGEADTYFSIPAACKVKGKSIRGWVGKDDKGYYFHPNSSELTKL